VVFDIQYGLNNESDLFENLPFEPENVMGNFTMDDILRHIGNFTYFLETNAAVYGANLDSVFVSGGSAGGQLTCATSLILASKNYSEFSSAFTIKGMVPFYPANNASLDFMENSRPEWVDPVLLLNASSPPCLIFQGNQDPLLIESQRLKNTYITFGRTDCAHIQFPFAGHGNDIYFPGFYNQIFLYYMERFLYLYH
jgi:acetyl esterase/lipase